MTCFLRIFDCCITQPQTLYEIAREQEEGGFFSSAKANYLKIIENGITAYRKRSRAETGYLAYQAPPELDRIQKTEEAKNYIDIMFMLNDEERLRGRMREAVFRLGVVLYKASRQKFEKSRSSYNYINESAANKYLRKMDVALSYISQAAQVGLEETSEYFSEVNAARVKLKEKLASAKEKREEPARLLQNYERYMEAKREANRVQFLAEAERTAAMRNSAESARQAERTRLIEEHPEIPHLERIHRDLQDLQSRVSYYGSKGK